MVFFDQTIKSSAGGKETLETLRQSGFNGKAVLVTGSPNSSVRTDYKACGFDGMVLKPFTKMDIQNVIEAVMGE